MPIHKVKNQPHSNKEGIDIACLESKKPLIFESELCEFCSKEGMELWTSFHFTIFCVDIHNILFSPNMFILVGMLTVVVL
jgi:hypothetical protein